MSTFSVPEELSTYYKSQVETILKFADVGVSATEQWFDLYAKSAKAATAEAMKQTRALAAAKDVQELTTLQTSFSQANGEKVSGFARAAYSWATETHSEFSKVVEEQIAETNKTMSAAIDKASKSAPSGSEFAFNAVKQAVSAANQAYDALSKASKQVVDMTEATVSASTGAIAPTAARKKVA
jgi:phasin family protein